MGASSPEEVVMRCIVITLALCALLGAATARAQGGINLSWDDCGASGTANQSFACDTNADSSVMVASFVVDVGGPCFVGTNAVFDLQVAGGSLPDWWQLKNPGTCRQKSLRALGPWQRGVSCLDPAAFCGGTPGVASYSIGFGGPNRARILTSYSVACTACLETAAGIESFAIELVIRHDKTSGSGSCDGCLMAACIVLNSIGVYASNPTPWDHLELSKPLQRSYITWQGGDGDCPGSTPALNRTWGALKSVYR
jgi:hypothetical protein